MGYFHRHFRQGLIVSLCASLFWPGICFGQQREAIDDLFYPQAKARSMRYAEQQIVYVQLSEADLKTVLLHYLKIGQAADWELIFPTALEAEVWLKSLGKHESPVFMLSLYNLKSKVNFSLTLGGVEKTSASQARSIITIYKMRHSFGRRGG